MAYDTRAYGKMIADPLRRAAFVSAMRAEIGPGTVVLDLGAGVGILSLLACRFGAERVYAVDPNPLVDLVKGAAKKNGFAEKIVVHCADSRDISLPERVDLIIADIRGALPLVGGSFDVVSDACKRFLKPGGSVLPARDTMFVAPVSESTFMSEWRSLWWDHGLDLDLGCLGDGDLGCTIQSWAKPEDLLSAAQTWGRFVWAPLPSLSWEHELVFQMQRDGVLDGFVEWFDLDFGGGVTLSNDIAREKLVYGRLTFLLSRPVEVRAGYIVRLRLRVFPKTKFEIWSWSGEVLDSAGVRVAAFNESTLKSAASQVLAKSAL